MRSYMESRREQAQCERIKLDEDLQLLVGQRIRNIEHVTGASDADEAIIITTESGIITVGTSEWLHISVTKKEPYKGAINLPCSACSAGDYKMEYHDHDYVPLKDRR